MVCVCSCWFVFVVVGGRLVLLLYSLWSLCVCVCCGWLVCDVVVVL